MNETPTPPIAPRPAPVRVGIPSVRPYLTYSILAFTIFIYLLQLAGVYLLGGDIVAALGLKSNALIRASQVWRLLTPVFLHDSSFPYGLLHIGFNMYAMVIYGRGLEARFGHARFALLYFLSGFAGNVLSFLMTPSSSLGASTAVFGLFAAEGMFILQNRRLLGNRAGRAMMNILYFVALNLFIGFSGTGIDNFGHLGGLLGGALFTWFGGPRWKLEGLYPSVRLVDERQGHGTLAGTIAVLLFFIPLAALGWIWGPGR